MKTLFNGKRLMLNEDLQRWTAVKIRKNQKQNQKQKGADSEQQESAQNQPKNNPLSAQRRETALFEKEMA